LKDFYNHHPESFNGRGDHNRAENWLNDVEELLAMIGGTNEQKVAYTAYKLIDQVKHCWQVKKVVLIADLGSETTVTWNIFKHEFNQHFFPRVV
jgi:dihydroxyacetone kinase DhaKLM complex PTS-EIIA-like component DhaM